MRRNEKEEVKIEIAKSATRRSRKLKENIKIRENENIKERGITLIALVITILFSYDEKIKCSNSKGFLLRTI